MLRQGQLPDVGVHGRLERVVAYLSNQGFNSVQTFERNALNLASLVVDTENQCSPGTVG